MIKKFNYSITILLLGLLFFSLFPYEAAFSLKYPLQTMAKEGDSNLHDPVYLVLDNDNYDVLPSKFRKTTDTQSISNDEKINTAGLETLNISGSQQFSEMNLPIILKAIDTELPIIDFDLRQESHGFVNGLPISFENERDNANEGLTDAQVLEREKEQLGSIKIGVPLTFYNKPDKVIIPEEVIDEETLVASNKIGYVRIFATDEILPTPSVIDSFVDEVKKIDKESWLHFHCKEGIGRTTTFMIFY
ncbi:MAG: protein tyrosine phosphatase, partial [Clostridium sp.]|nr:protein tyrosine phosphatase [Clostridium sp.]